MPVGRSLPGVISGEFPVLGGAIRRLQLLRPPRAVLRCLP